MCIFFTKGEHDLLITRRKEGRVVDLRNLRTIEVGRIKLK